MESDDVEYESRSVDATLRQLLDRNGWPSALETSGRAKTMSGTLEPNQASLSRHLDSIRRAALQRPEPEIKHYTCSSTTVLDVLSKLSKMFN